MQWKNNSNTFIEVEWSGARNEPRIKLPEGPFVHSCQQSKKGMRISFTQVFILEEIPGKWHGWWLVPPYRLLLWCALHHHAPTSVQNVDSALAGAKRSALHYRENTVTHIKILISLQVDFRHFFGCHFSSASIINWSFSTDPSLPVPPPRWKSLELSFTTVWSVQSGDKL